MTISSRSIISTSLHLASERCTVNDLILRVGEAEVLGLLGGVRFRPSVTLRRLMRRCRRVGRNSGASGAGGGLLAPMTNELSAFRGNRPDIFQEPALALSVLHHRPSIV